MPRWTLTDAGATMSINKVNASGTATQLAQAAVAAAAGVSQNLRLSVVGGR